MLAFATAIGPVNPISGASQYEPIPRDMRGRIFGPLGVALIGAAPAGALGAGLLTDIIGLRTRRSYGGALYSELLPVFHLNRATSDNSTPRP